MKLVSSPNKVHDILVYALSLHPCVHVRYRKILNKVLNQLLIPFYHSPQYSSQLTGAGPLPLPLAATCTMGLL